MTTAPLPLLVATNNHHKLQEIREVLVPLGFSLQGPAEAGVALDPEEWGETFAQNATIKAMTGLRETRCMTLADDSGLEVDALGGRPGVYSARFAGPAANDEANNRKVAELMADVADGDRSCRFRCVMALAWREGLGPSLSGRLSRQIGELSELVAPGYYVLSDELAARLAGGEISGPCHLLLCDGAMEGRFARAPRGASGFGYDPWVELAEGRHVAELSSEEKHALSHRGEALRKLSDALRAGS